MGSEIPVSLGQYYQNSICRIAVQGGSRRPDSRLANNPIAQRTTSEIANLCPVDGNNIALTRQCP